MAVKSTTMKQEGTAELEQHPTKRLPCKIYCKWSGSQTARQQTQPAQPSQPNPASPPHPNSTQPASHPNMINCNKLHGFPQGLGITVNSDVFAERIKHRKNIWIWQTIMRNVRDCVQMYVFFCEFLQNANACKYYVKTHAFAPQMESDNTT